jgi:triacylglycerol lipase
VALVLPAPLEAVDRCRAERDAVILLHGLGRTPKSMAKLERTLRADGYEVINLGYPSREEPIELLALRLDETIGECCRGHDRYTHFVTHSMGGILLRYYLKTRPLDTTGRVVMLSPPNAGSELVDLLKRVPVLKEHVGPSRQQLGTHREDLPVALGPVDFELGVVAGDRGLLPPLSWIVPGEDDGVVAVERMRVEGMSDFVVLPSAHSFIMRSDRVIAQTRTFLATGRFAPADAAKSN